ncbi:MAG TPA: hypothetical protein VE053_08195 [Allosphingosinicella sp.]|nr:hypothetical protein [Allosphingosinicella sp.]
MAGSGSLVQAALAVNRVRISSGYGSRADAEGWLDSVPLERLGLGPEEILHVPRLGLRLSARGKGPAAAGERILESLRSMLESAERDPLPGSSTGGACRFSSLARYLAWVAGLWLEGGAGGRAAAAAAIGSSPDAGTLRAWQRREILADAARLVPVVAHLARSGLASIWAAGLDPPDRALAKTGFDVRFGLDLKAGSGPAVASTVEAPRPAGSRGRLRQARVSAPPAPPLPLAIAKAAAILRGEGNGWRRLDEEARTILLAACALAGSPSAAGRPGFAEALRAAARDAERHPVALARTAAAIAATDDDSAFPGLPHQAPGRPPARGRSGRDGRAEAAAVPSAAPGQAPADAAKTHVPPRPLGGRLPARDAGALAERPSDAPGAVTFTSRFAGILFLLNAFVALGLYPDFTAPGGRRLRPSPLWLADRIARVRFGNAYRSDPLSRWIATGATAGPLPRYWRTDDDWLRGFRARPRPRWSHDSGRATLWHASGFPLVDAPEHTRFRSRHRYRDEAPARGRLPRAPDSRWIFCLRLFLEARVRLATGDARGLALLALPGEIRADELDLTAVFRLDAHPIGLRLAGLDRDLGWQPAEGRSIRFRFE